MLEELPKEIWLGLFGIFGLLIGSFLNVVIYRLPKIMQQQWDQEEQTLWLSRPASHCPHCGRSVRWYENIPIFSWVLLKGRCKGCKAAISWRYPLVELACALLFVACALQWGHGHGHGHQHQAQALAASGICAALLCLALIDLETTLLPDAITQPLLWAGMIGAALGWGFAPLDDALWGAVAGYLSLWSIYWLFKLATGKEGMGYGDFKLLAALGAWLGWQALLPIILISSVLGAAVGIALKVSARLESGAYIPFGPFLAGAGLVVMFWGASDAMLILLG